MTSAQALYFYATIGWWWFVMWRLLSLSREQSHTFYIMTMQFSVGHGTWLRVGGLFISVHFGVSEYINSNAILKVNYAICNYLGYNYVNIIVSVLQYLPMRMANSYCVMYSLNLYLCVHVTRPCKIAVVHKQNYLSEYYNDSIKWFTLLCWQ